MKKHYIYTMIFVSKSGLLDNQYSDIKFVHGYNENYNQYNLKIFLTINAIKLL